MIREAAEMIRRLRQRLAGAPQGAAAAEVAAAARAAQSALLGAQASMFAILDAETAARLVGDPERVRLWADLLRVEGAAHRATGDAATAERLDQRAASLEAVC